MRGRLWVPLLLALGLPACGGVSDNERFSLRTPGTDQPIVREIEGSQKIRTGKPTAAEVATIRGWADALRAGHIAAAARFFAVPALVADGTNPLRRLKNRNAVRQFNRALPCGAKLQHTQRGASSFVIARFRLTERKGSTGCGTGVGQSAYTAFLIENRRILQWRRAGSPTATGSGSGG